MALGLWPWNGLRRPEGAQLVGVKSLPSEDSLVVPFLAQPQYTSLGTRRVKTGTAPLKGFCCPKGGWLPADMTKVPLNE